MSDAAYGVFTLEYKDIDALFAEARSSLFGKRGQLVQSRAAL